MSTSCYGKKCCSHMVRYNDKQQVYSNSCSKTTVEFSLTQEDYVQIKKFIIPYLYFLIILWYFWSTYMPTKNSSVKSNEQNPKLSPSNSYKKPFQNKNKVIIIVSNDFYQYTKSKIYRYFGLYIIINYVPALYKINYRHTTRLNLYLCSILKIMNNDRPICLSQNNTIYLHHLLLHAFNILVICTYWVRNDS